MRRREGREREEASAWRARGWSKGARAGVEEEADAGSRARGRGVIGAMSTTRGRERAKAGERFPRGDRMETDRRPHVRLSHPKKNSTL